MISNIPEVKLGIIAVSRDCFPIALSEMRRSAIVKAYQGELYECPVTVENELDMLKAVADVKAQDCNALVVFLNFAREAGIRTITLAGFDGFSPSQTNYFEGSADLSKSGAEMAEINRRLRLRLKEANAHFALRFLTESAYCDQE